MILDIRFDHFPGGKDQLATLLRSLPSRRDTLVPADCTMGDVAVLDTKEEKQ